MQKSMCHIEAGIYVVGNSDEFQNIKNLNCLQHNRVERDIHPANEY